MRVACSLGAVALVALGACRANRDGQAQSAAPAGAAAAPGDGGTDATHAGVGDGGTAAAAAGGAPGATGDAAASAAVDAGGDARTDARAAAARAWPVAPGAAFPDFGCIGWSRSRGVLACVLGGSFSDSGLDASLEFLPLRTNAEAIEPLALIQSPSRRATAFPPDKIAPFNELLRGFAPIERGVARIESHWVDDKLVVDPPATVGGMTIMIQLAREGTAIFAPKHRATLWVRFAGQPKVMVDDTADALSHVQARLFVLDGAVMVERIYSVGDEGTYGTFIHLWRCMPDHCVPPGDAEFAMSPRPAAP